MTKRRLFLGAMAMLPMLAFAFVGFLGVPVLGESLAFLGFSLIVTLTAVVVAFRDRFKARTLRRIPALLRTGVVQRLQADLPSEAQQRDIVAKTLVPEALPVQGAHLAEPETARAALMRMMKQAMHSLGTDDIEHATSDQVAQMYLFLQVMRETPGEAGRLAGLFRNPADVLELRDRLNDTANRRISFERQRECYNASRSLWALKTHAKPCSLKDSLARLGLPDPDLWHQLITLHDPLQIDQLNAALWCLEQPDCDRATAAAFLRRVLQRDILLELHSERQTDALAQIQKVSARWNESGFSKIEIALPAAKNPDTEKDAMNAALDALAKKSGAQRWPSPLGIHDIAFGRPAQSRSNWCLVTGTMIFAPRYEDYVDLPIAESIAA